MDAPQQKSFSFICGLWSVVTLSVCWQINFVCVHVGHSIKL